MVQTRFFVRGITFKTSKSQLFLSHCTFLPKFRYGTTKPQKRMWYYWKMKILFFCMLYTIWTLSHPKMKFCSFPISSQFNFKNGHFFKPSNGQNGNFNNHKQLIIQLIFMAICIEEIYLKYWTSRYSELMSDWFLSFFWLSVYYGLLYMT